ncbi:tRNA(Met) cytidine acetate ligase [Acidaminococcus fermentans]|uniref:tRNA(Met) cytidine acetate ligase n=1 Tax=Acidaminococcus fermentans TaxID=905 RepID=UPI00242C6B6E|nr:nucleotidyltransferase family protein [Acidaminococcus fermentans]MCI6286904.1 nucleotidyltransferase family protein [Acidaminococcus fermentans]
MEHPSVVGLVAEYNPFHRGHGHQLEAVRSLLGPALPVIAVMSGSLTQRGELPLWDKWRRTRLALLGGADLVLELPVTGSLQSAQGFAFFGVELLAATGLVTHLSFGCEARDPEALVRLSREEFTPEEWRQALGDGLSYGAAAARLASERDPAYGNLFTGSNNLLALEYLRALRPHPEIRPLPIRREGTLYGSRTLDENGWPSASALRQELQCHGFTEAAAGALPPALRPLCRAWWEEGLPLPDRERALDTLLAYALETGSPEGMAACTQVSEGLEDRIWKLRHSGGFATLVEQVSTRRYSPSRIRRLLWQYLLSGPDCRFRDAAQTGPRYLRVLGMTQTGRQLLRAMKKTARLPLLTGIQKNTLGKAPDPGFRQQLRLDIRAQDLFQLVTEGRVTDRDYKEKPVVLF